MSYICESNCALFTSLIRNGLHQKLVTHQRRVLAVTKLSPQLVSPPLLVFRPAQLRWATRRSQQAAAPVGRRWNEACKLHASLVPNTPTFDITQITRAQYLHRSKIRLVKNLKLPSLFLINKKVDFLLLWCLLEELESTCFILHGD